MEVVYLINEKQEQVINELERNILLLASAGTGKTNTLANRIAKILQNKLSTAEEILCITFTNKACKEMKERIITTVDNAENVEVKTFHSLCFDIIKREAKRNTDVSTNFIIYDEEDCLNVIEEIFDTPLPYKDLKDVIDFIKEARLSYGFITNSLKRDLNKTISRLKNDINRMEDFLNNHKKRRDLIEKIILKEGCNIVVRYGYALKKYGALDFQDLISSTLLLFNDEEIVNQVASKYKYINIDEIQDTSIIEYNLIEKIFKNSNVLLCGDTFQTIYEWRGSAPTSIVEDFKKKYNPVEISFDKNYRATKRLTECATEYLYKAFPVEVASTLKDGLSSNSPILGEKIPFHVSGNTSQEAKWIYKQIMSLPITERKKACILTRNNSYNVTLSKELRKIQNSELSFALIDDTKFFRKKEIKDIIAFLKIAINHYDGTALKRIIRTLGYNIDEELIQKIESEKCKSAGVSITDFIDEEAIKNNDKYSALEKELINENIVVFDVESTGTDTTRDEIIQIAAIRINAKGEEVERFMKFLKPNKPVGSSEKVHGFSDEYLNKYGRNKKNTIKSFLKFIKGRTLVGHNVQYDINILKSEIERNDLPNAEYKGFYDTLDIYRRFYPSIENHKLCTLSTIVNTKHKPNHNALYDILATGEILVYAVDNFIKPTKKKRTNIMKSNADKFSKLAIKLNKFFDETKYMRPMETIQYIVKEFKLLDIYGSKSQEADNMREFYFTAKENEDKSLCPRDALIDFTTNSTLSDGEMEKLVIEKGKIPIITVHQAKGLEFDYIFLAGLQDNVFPNTHSIESEYLDEEKRVFYVALTRAKKKLYMSYSKYRRGGLQEKSRLLAFVDSKYLIRA